MNFKKWDDYIVKPGIRIRLDKIPSDVPHDSADKEKARKALKEYRRQIDELLRVLSIENKRSLLVVLQGMDASGKDGAVRRVFTGINPQHCDIVSFKEPAGEELAHDYLWRVYRSLPAKGACGVFNRSQYEDVLVPLARGSLSPQQARTRLRQIVDLERIWSENGISICKLFLHISPEEQTSRFQSRLDEPEKHWKVKESDFADRKRWKAFQAAYGEILALTSAKDAPWYIIPADRKWYRDVAVAGIVLSKLRAMRPRLPKPRLDRSRYPL